MAEPLDWLPQSDSLPRRTLAKDEVLIVQGAPTDVLHVVLSGALVVDLETKEGLFRLGRKEPGDWVGEMGMMVPGAASATVVAEEPTEVVSLDHATYARCRDDKTHHVGRLLSRIACDVSRRLRGASELGIETREGGASKRLVPLLRTLMGVDRQEVMPTWVPPSASGHTQRMSNEQLLQRMESVGVFGDLSTEGEAYADAVRKDLAAIASTIAVEDHGDGDVICQEGSAASGLYFVLEGEVREVAGKDDAWMHEDVVRGPGDCFGLVPFFDDGKHRTTCTAVGSVQLAVMYASTVQHLIRSAEHDQPLGVHLMDGFVRRLVADARHLNARIQAQAETT